jgi:RNA polymerase sigma-70 factor, ECF subfamily
VVQEIFLTLWRDPSRFDQGGADFATWLLTVTHHRAVDTVRGQSAHPSARGGCAGGGQGLVA